MRKIRILGMSFLAAVVVVFVLTACQNPTLRPVAGLESDPSILAKKAPVPEDTTIQDGIIEYSDGHYLEGELLEVGFDPYGYNYQAHMFKGSYANAYLGGAGFPPYEGDEEAYLVENPAAEDHWSWPYRDVQLAMKWNDAWLSNMDRDGNRKLDRHFGFDSYIGSGGWLTNHESEGQGKDRRTSIIKIVAAPADATMVGGVWYAADGTEIGPIIWGAFAIIQEVESGLGATYVSPSGPGLGKF
jgi:hypothetical protein